jgi:uncharacterized membrane protein YeaQ/YmgE (transglycosylase-associated protein family)
MTWMNGLILQTIAGLVGAHLAAVAAPEYRFGWIGHSLTGLVGGAFSGAFLQSLASTIVNGNGDPNLSTPAEMFTVQFLTGAVAGAILAIIVGFLKSPTR